MDTDLTSISKHAVPRTDYRIRRRKYNQTIWLLHNNDWFVIDDVTDCVWRACARGLTVEAIVHHVRDEMQMPLNEALAATVITLERFSVLGFLNWEEDA